MERDAVAAQIEGAAAIRNLIKDFTVRRPGRPEHTAGVVAIDAEGNVAAVTHSVTSSVWGELGIFVDGISITDPGGFAQRQIARIGPGTKLDAAEVEAGCPMIVLRDGKPVLGCGSVGASYYEVSLQGMVNVLDFGMDAPTAAMQPQFRRAWPPGEPLRQPLGDGEFTRTLLEAVRALGIDLEVVEDRGLASSAGSWVGVTIDPVSGELRGGLTSRRNWLVEAW
jgi:gamma-glutamyltranspeptidase/glutathione hydrolase